MALANFIFVLLYIYWLSEEPKKSRPPRVLFASAGAACLGMLACLLAFLEARFASR